MVGVALGVLSGAPVGGVLASALGCAAPFPLLAGYIIVLKTPDPSVPSHLYRRAAPFLPPLPEAQRARYGGALPPSPLLVVVKTPHPDVKRHLNRRAAPFLILAGLALLALAAVAVALARVPRELLRGDGGKDGDDGVPSAQTTTTVNSGDDEGEEGVGEGAEGGIPGGLRGVLRVRGVGASAAAVTAANLLIGLLEVRRNDMLHKGLSLTTTSDRRAASSGSVGVMCHVRSGSL